MKLNLSFRPSISINNSISTLPKIIKTSCILVLLICIEKSIWWTLKPNSSNYLTQSNVMYSNDSLTQQLTFLAPFGVIKEIKKEAEVQETPKDKVIIYGVYSSGPKNSMALVKVNDKDLVLQIGDELSGGKIITIMPTEVTTMQGDKIMSYKVSANPTTEQSEFANSSTTTNPSKPAQPEDNDNDNNSASKSHDPEINNIAEQRRKMIKQFQDENNENQSNKSNSSS